MPIHIALFEPEIPPNTGAIMRLCANGGFTLHLVEPLGFTMDDTKLRRAGLDYRDLATVHQHTNLAACIEATRPTQVLAFSTKGKRRYTDWHYEENQMLVFGPESRGLPDSVLDTFADNLLRIPMLAESRSLNLANAVSLVAYEAWRQMDFVGAADSEPLSP